MFLSVSSLSLVANFFMPVQVIDISLYTTMEPCSERLSKKDACVQRILNFNRANVVIDGARLAITRVVQGVREPDDFVVCAGTQLLQDQGLSVVHLDPGTSFERTGRRYLELEPNASDHAEVEQWIDELEAQLSDIASQ